MREACLFFSQKNLILPRMASPRGEVGSHEKDPRLRGIPHNTSETGYRRPLSPVRECTVVTDRADSSETSGSTANASVQDASQVPSHYEPTLPQGPLHTIQRTSPVATVSDPMIRKTDQEQVASGSESDLSKPLEPSLPQHEIIDSKPDYEAILEHNKNLLMRGLSLSSAAGNLTLVSDEIQSAVQSVV